MTWEIMPPLSSLAAKNILPDEAEHDYSVGHQNLERGGVANSNRVVTMADGREASLKSSGVRTVLGHNLYSVNKKCCDKKPGHQVPATKFSGFCWPTL